MSNTFRCVTALTLAALFGLAALPAAQAQTALPDTIVVRSDANDARKRFNEGNELLRAEDFEGALTKFEEGMALDPTNPRNAYGRALVLVQLEREDEAVVAFEQAVALADSVEDAETASTARKAVGTIAYRNAMKLLQANPLPEATAEEALPLLEQAEAGALDNSMLPYQFARVYNVLGRHDDAERYAEQAVGANESASDKSAFYIELGLARMNLDDSAGARKAFEMAKEGAWSGWAEHYLTQLDTDGGMEEGSMEMEEARMEEAPMEESPMEDAMSDDAMDDRETDG